MHFYIFLSVGNSDFYFQHEISLFFCVFSSKTPHSSEKDFSFMKNRIIGQDLMMYGLQTRK